MAEQPPEQFGRYTIIKRLGQGGMGSVYLAEDTQLGRKVALKLPDFGPHEGPEARKRFLKEARTAATLDHPYLCRIHDAGELDGNLFLTMAYIEGQSLAALIVEEGLPERQVAALVGKLALAMQEAHAKKVIHRDLKPANVMIKTTGARREPVIVDFGLAHRDNPEEQRLTRSGQIMGTLGYMAPEQVRGDLKEIGPACDIYALGVILYELLTGRLPFNGSGLAVVGQILAVTPLPPSTHRSGLDPALEAICLKAMAKQVRDRYASMGELATALTGFLRPPSATPPPTSPSGRPGSSARTSAEVTQPTGRNSLVGQSLDQLGENQAKSITNKIGMTLVLIPAGEFLMGSPNSDKDAGAAEKPQHRLRITRPFYLGVHQVTQGQYRAVTGANPSHFKGSDDLPVVQVSWYEAIAFCNKLSEREGLEPYYERGAVSPSGGEGYRLPTEAEWEYACRAGSTTRYSFGDDAVRLGAYAWCNDNSDSKTHPVGRKRPNDWGLYDMHGSVWEWCWDGYDPNYYGQSPGADPVGRSQAADRVLRGGSWISSPRYCRSALRGRLAPGIRNSDLGFRIARFQTGPLLGSALVIPENMYLDGNYFTGIL